MALQKVRHEGGIGVYAAFSVSYQKEHYDTEEADELLIRTDTKRILISQSLHQIGEFFSDKKSDLIRFLSALIRVKMRFPVS